MEKIDERTQMLWDDIKKSSMPATGILAKGASVWRDRQTESEETVEVTIDKNLLKQ